MCQHNIRKYAQEEDVEGGGSRKPPRDVPQDRHTGIMISVMPEDYMLHSITYIKFHNTSSFLATPRRDTIIKDDDV